MNQALFSYITACPTPYQAVANTAKLLRAQGYEPLPEQDAWTLRAGGRYFVTRNDSSLIAFRLPVLPLRSFQMTASHCDSPCLRIKENAELESAGCIQLSTEVYGGMLRGTWTDRPLSIAGRILVKTPAGVQVHLVDLREPAVIIPSVAIHMNRKANENMSWNPAVDLLPLCGTLTQKDALRRAIAAAAGVAEADILTADLSVYNPQPGVTIGDLIAAPRLDDLQCAFAALEGFLHAKDSAAAPVYCLFNNEEVGSLTRQGASSTFLPDVLLRISECCGMTPADYRRAVAASFLVSCDNAHAVHPNHPELSDKNHGVHMNGGIVIKYNANQKYTSDALSAALFRTVCEAAGVPVQSYANRADIPGGSTLGNLLNAQVSLCTVDIGLPQLAMHSACETAGAADTALLVRALTEFYSRALTIAPDGAYAMC